MIEKLPTTGTPDPSTQPVVHVERERLVFTIPDELRKQATGEPATYAISLESILEAGDTHGALLWGQFFQLLQIVDLQREIIAASQQQRAEVSAKMQGMDPTKIMRDLMATMQNPGGAPGAPGGDGSRVCSGGTVTPKGD